jgi:tRNA threonylcarbamoyladenosine biosynthesis protein TsaB
LITLIIDTSTDKALVAFAEGNALLLNCFLPPGAQSSRYLMATIEAGFKQLKLPPASLKAVAVGVGPGSYTGIRVGAAAAYGLALPKALPLIGFCSLEGFVCTHDGRFASLIDARTGGAYVLLQERVGEAIKVLASPQFIAKEHLACYLEGYPAEAGPHIGYPDPAYLARLAAQKLERGECALDLELIYLRQP